jgi:hypothetical protein
MRMNRQYYSIFPCSPNLEADSTSGPAGFGFSTRNISMTNVISSSRAIPAEPREVANALCIPSHQGPGSENRAGKIIENDRKIGRFTTRCFQSVYTMKPIAPARDPFSPVRAQGLALGGAALRPVVEAQAPELVAGPESRAVRDRKSWSVRGHGFGPQAHGYPSHSCSRRTCPSGSPRIRPWGADIDLPRSLPTRRRQGRISRRRRGLSKART